MFKTIIHIDGMQCGMCESHINDAVRKNFNIQKVSSSHSKKETIVISKNKLDEQKLKDVIGNAGYDFLSAASEPYQKKGLFGFLK